VNAALIQVVHEATVTVTEFGGTTATPPFGAWTSSPHGDTSPVWSGQSSRSQRSIDQNDNELGHGLSPTSSV